MTNHKWHYNEIGAGNDVLYIRKGVWFHEKSGQIYLDTKAIDPHFLDSSASISAEFYYILEHLLNTKPIAEKRHKARHTTYRDLICLQLPANVAPDKVRAFSNALRVQAPMLATVPKRPVRKGRANSSQSRHAP